MTKELVISANRHETKVAILEDDQLVEVYFQRSNEYSLVGSVHKGRVTRVLPGMQSAFVDLGLERDAFLYVSDFLHEEGSEDYERVGGGDGKDERGRGRGRDGRRDGRDRGRDERRAEDRRPQEAPRPLEEKPAVEAAVAAPASVEAPAAASPATSAEGERPADRTNEREGRRGRGRRRRRRGGRGGGLPESKFAAAPSAGFAEPASGPAEGPEEELEPLVLPGESIAKYSAMTGEEPEAEEPEADEAATDAPADPAAAAAPEAPVEGSGVAQVGPVTQEVRDEVEDLVAEAISEKEVDQIQEAAESARESGEAMEDSAAAQASPEAGLPADDGLPDSEDMAEGEEPEAEEEGAGEEAGAGEEGEGEPVTEGPLEADLREQPVARYIQRGQRRPRRRGGRSGGGDRYDPVPRSDSAQVVRPEGGKPEPERRERGERPALPSISELLKEGQEIIVQIAKEPLGQKGARITSHIAMPGRYVVFMPTLDHLGVSRKVGSDEERQRLKRIVQTHAQGMAGGFIVRTAGEGRPEAEIAADMQYLYNQWLDIRKRAEKRRAPCLLHHDLELVMRTLRDQVNEQFKAVWVDNEEIYENIVGFLERFQPSLVNRVKMYTRDTPIFDTFNITAELEKALRPKVWLKSGGYIVINQTEALVAIDINTGKYVGKSNRLEDTIVKTNLEAIKEIVRQIRLRDLGGIIVVDFIDMDERKNRNKIMQGLEEAMSADRAPYKILQFNDFGLVAITRRRVKQSLERALCQPCPTCEGAGYVKSVQTIVGEILTEAYKIAPALEGKDVILRVNPDVAKELKAAEQNYIQELEEILKRPVLIKSDPLLHPEKFDLA